VTRKRVGPALAPTSPAPKKQAHPDSTAARLPGNRCRACRRPTLTSVCGPCRAWHRYLEAIGSIAEVAR
jgi:hypothetical protein